MALAFFIMLLPGFETSIDLAGIRDRFVGILVGITATWIFFDHFWHTSSRRQVVEKLVAILHLMAKAPNIITAATSPDEARKQATLFRRNLSNELDAGRLYLDETKIELTLALKPSTAHGNQLEIMAAEVSFAAFLLLALNAKKLRLLASGNLGSIQTVLRPADAALATGFTTVADEFEQFHLAVFESQTLTTIRDDLSLADSALASLSESSVVEFDMRAVYQSLHESLIRIAKLDWLVRSLSE